MGMPMLDTQGNYIQSDLRNKPSEYQRANLQIITRAWSSMRMIQFRKQVQHRQAEQVSAGKRVEQLYVARLVKFEKENAGRAQNNGGKQKQVIHTVLIPIANDLH